MNENELNTMIDIYTRYLEYDLNESDRIITLKKVDKFKKELYLLKSKNGNLV